ncbi:TlpA family protein disulfide reductase [Mucilaginibacter litoreus]|uniref:TlpA family protein disulfide reductase n=1 Tax=Mucilaginibacter litoreus TaxID=1048221 RepID=A0ABW3AXA9_9SPHI
MRKMLLSLIILQTVICNSINAQIALLNTAVAKINSYKNISYEQISKQKNPFSSDWSSFKLNAITSPATTGQNGLYNIKDERGYQNIYNGSASIDLDLTNKTYEISNGPKQIGWHTPYYWAHFIKQCLNRGPQRVLKLADTMINKTACYYISLVMLDSLPAKEVHDFYLSKTTYLPVFVRQYLQGVFGKGDIMGTQVSVMINEDSYSGYRVNNKLFTDIASFTIPVNFKPAKKAELIMAGTKAPGWQLKDLQGNTISSQSLRNKVILIDFSFNACAACMLSIPMLNKLHERYKGDNVQIITVNVADTKESVARFAKKNNINYSILLNGKQVAENFKVSAYPTFYLIDKSGNIASAAEGFDTDFETKLSAKIDSL